MGTLGSALATALSGLFAEWGKLGSVACRSKQCSQQNLPSKVLPFVMYSPASLACSATPGKTAAREEVLMAGFPGSTNKAEGVLPGVLPVGRTFCQRL